MTGFGHIEELKAANEQFRLGEPVQPTGNRVGAVSAENRRSLERAANRERAADRAENRKRSKEIADLKQQLKAANEMQALDADTIADLKQELQAASDDQLNAQGGVAELGTAWTRASEHYIAALADRGVRGKVNSSPSGDDRAAGLKGQPPTANALGQVAAAEKVAKQLLKELGSALKRLDPNHGNHGAEALPPTLKNYKLIKDADGVKQITGARGAKVKPLLAAILEDPESETAMRGLEDLTAKLTLVYQAEIDTRLADEDVFAKSTAVIIEGNSTFLDVYTAVAHMVEVSEPDGVREFKAAAARGRDEVAATRADPEFELADGAPPRNPSEMPALCQASARAKPHFDTYVKQVIAEHDAECGDAQPSHPGSRLSTFAGLDMAVKLELPDELKDFVRALEKSLLVADPTAPSRPPSWANRAAMRIAALTGAEVEIAISGDPGSVTWSSPPACCKVLGVEDSPEGGQPTRRVEFTRGCGDLNGDVTSDVPAWHLRSVAGESRLGDCGCVLDVVRGMIVVIVGDTLSALAAVYDRLLKHPKLWLVRQKERFFESPSAGGWRDLMANFFLLHPDTGAVTCVVEIQLCHSKMLTARKDLPGHLVCGPVRVAAELLERKFGSTGVAADAVALVAMHRANLPDGGPAVDEASEVESDHTLQEHSFNGHGIHGPTPGHHHSSAKDLVLEDKGWLSGEPLGQWDLVEIDHRTGRIVGLNLRGIGLQGRLSRDLAGMTELCQLNLDENADLLPIAGAPTDSHGVMRCHTKEQTQAFLRHLALDDQGREMEAQRQRLVLLHGPDGPALRTIFDEGRGRSWANPTKRWFTGGGGKVAADPAGWHGMKRMNGGGRVVALSLEGTGISVMPESMMAGVSGLVALTELDLTDCGSLTAIPEGIAGLTALTALNLDGCAALTALPEGIAGLAALTSLTLSGCGALTALPEGIAGLTALTKLNLGRCTSLVALPQEIAGLPKLKRVTLTDCTSLTTLPAGIARLASL